MTTETPVSRDRSGSGARLFRFTNRTIAAHTGPGRQPAATAHGPGMDGTITQAVIPAPDEVPGRRKPFARARALARFLYEGDAPPCHAFRYGLLAFDLATLAFIVASSFLPEHRLLSAIDVGIGLVVLADLGARVAASRRPWREFGHLTTWADLIALVSFLAPLVGEGAGFLRILRTLRVLRAYHVRERLRADSALFRSNEDLILAAVNLAVFVFVMTSLVYATQRWTNPAIANYVDALYFTVTSLTTTGYGDVTLQGTSGRLLSVAIMVCGVTLFLRLAQVLFRPPKVRHDCPSCGLSRHDGDAVHCKACGVVLNIPDEGAD